MSGEFLKAQTELKDSESKEEKSGLMAGKVIRNCDQTKMGRVKVRLAARGGREIWARVVAPDTGVYFVPQVNDEVLVAFHQGDGNEAFVMGRLWNDTKLPPRQGEGDPVTKRVILTPKELIEKDTKAGESKLQYQDVKTRTPYDQAEPMGTHEIPWMYRELVKTYFDAVGSRGTHDHD